VILSNKDERKNEIVAFNDFAPTGNSLVGSVKKSYEREKRQKKKKKPTQKKSTRARTGKEKKMLKKSYERITKFCMILRRCR
jgi:hypothetical protein